MKHKEYIFKVYLNGELRCSRCRAKHLIGMTFELTDISEPLDKPKGAFHLKQTNKKGTFLLDIPYKQCIIRYTLVKIK